MTTTWIGNVEYCGAISTSHMDWKTSQVGQFLSTMWIEQHVDPKDHLCSLNAGQCEVPWNNLYPLPA